MATIEGKAHYRENLEVPFLRAALVLFIGILLLICYLNLSGSEVYSEEIWDTEKDSLLKQSKSRIQNLEMELSKMQMFINRTRSTKQATDDNQLKIFCLENPLLSKIDTGVQCGTDQTLKILAHSYAQIKVNYRALFSKRQVERSFFAYDADRSLMMFLNFNSEKTADDALRLTTGTLDFETQFKKQFDSNSYYQTFYMRQHIFVCAKTLLGVANDYMCTSISAASLLNTSYQSRNASLLVNSLIVAGSFQGYQSIQLPLSFFGSLELPNKQYDIDLYVLYNCVSLLQQQIQQLTTHVGSCMFTYSGRIKIPILYSIDILEMPSSTIWHDSTSSSTTKIGLIVLANYSKYGQIVESFKNKASEVANLAKICILIFMAFFLLIKFLGQKIYTSLLEKEFIEPRSQTRKMLLQKSTASISVGSGSIAVASNNIFEQPKFDLQEFRGLNKMLMVYEWAGQYLSLNHASKKALKLALSLIPPQLSLDFRRVLEYIYLELIRLDKKIQKHSFNFPISEKFHKGFRNKEPSDVIVEERSTVTDVESEQGWEIINLYQRLIQLRLKSLKLQQRHRISEEDVSEVYRFEVEKLEHFLQHVQRINNHNSQEDNQTKKGRYVEYFKAVSRRLLEYEEKFPNIDRYLLDQGELLQCKIRAELGLEVPYRILETLYKLSKYESIKVEATYLLASLLDKKFPQFYLQSVDLLTQTLLNYNTTSAFKHKSLFLIWNNLHKMLKYQKKGEEDNPNRAQVRIKPQVGLHRGMVMYSGNKPLPSISQSPSAEQISHIEPESQSEQLTAISRELKNMSLFFSPDRAVILLIESAVTPLIETLVEKLIPTISTAKVICLRNFIGEEKKIKPHQNIIEEISKFYSSDSTKTRKNEASAISGLSSTFRSIQHGYRDYLKYVVIFAPEYSQFLHENRSQKNAPGATKASSMEEETKDANLYMKVLLISNGLSSETFRKGKMYRECQKLHEFMFVDTSSFDEASYTQQVNQFFS